MPDKSKVELPELNIKWSPDMQQSQAARFGAMLNERERQFREYIAASLQREAEAKDSTARANHDLKIVQDAAMGYKADADNKNAQLEKAEAEVQRLETTNSQLKVDLEEYALHLVPNLRKEIARLEELTAAKRE